MSHSSKIGIVPNDNQEAWSTIADFIALDDNGIVADEILESLS